MAEIVQIAAAIFSADEFLEVMVIDNWYFSLLRGFRVPALYIEHSTSLRNPFCAIKLFPIGFPSRGRY